MVARALGIDGARRSLANRAFSLQVTYTPSSAPQEETLCIPLARLRGLGQKR